MPGKGRSKKLQQRQMRALTRAAYALRHSTITGLIAVHRLGTMTVAQLNGTSVAMIEKHYGHSLRDHAVTPASEQERAQVDALCEQVQKATGHTVKLAWADQGCTGEQAKSDAAQNGVEWQVVKLLEAKKGFVLLPKRWIVERSFAWLARFRRLSRDFERMPEVLAGLHFVVFAMLMLPKAALLLASGASS